LNGYSVLVALHLLGASVWVGGHLVLSFAVLPRALRARDPAIVRDFEAGFERIGIPALLLQVVTGILLALRWAPDVASWFSPDSPQERLVLAKLATLGLTMLLALHARLRLIPNLGPGNLRFLAVHIALVTLLGLVFLVLGVAIRTGATL
jgi:putative copper export protein